MSAVAIEFCDPEIAVVRAREVPVSSPGIALFGAGEALRLGAAAVARARLAPRSVHNRFWDRLGLEALAQPADGIATVADLAAAHLSHLWTGAHPDARSSEGAILVVPGGFDREQLGVLLGVVQSCGISAIGMVDAAVAACSALEAPSAGSRIVHVDVLLHRSILTEVIRETGSWQRSEVRSHRQLGLASLHDLWAKFAAELFVRSTRFDPLHRAESEQALFDRLPGALAALVEEPRVLVEIAGADAAYRVTLDRDQLAQLARPQYERLMHALEGMRSPDREMLVALSSRAAALPGLRDALQARLGCQVETLATAAAGFAALSRRQEICPVDGGLRLITSLRELDAGAGAAAPRPNASSPILEPTHVLFGNVAHAVTELGLRIAPGREHAAELRIVAADAEAANAITLRAGGGQLTVEVGDATNWLHNDAALRPGARLRLGDWLQHGPDAGGLQLIRLATRDGT